MKVTDPGCGMSIEPEKAHASGSYEVRSYYYFCSAQCQRAFKTNAAKYAGKGGQACGGHGAHHHHS